ncbi:unnamed protein product [Cuscuta europaea]|uniref:Spindle and kinetochore-associated protein 3 n=1 Tax=Cuscuta europaea TaxID=41803 RepID=A0A9P0YYS5_CUSEU|nr:unnamed protein product [Cuscuta europaea]
MDATIEKFSKTAAAFCNHLQTSCDALTQSVSRRPIPLDSASTTFVQCLSWRVSSASRNLNLLESMSLGTVSFEELLGHCNEVYKENQNQLLSLQDHLPSLGYTSSFDIDDEEEEEENEGLLDGFSSIRFTKKIEDDPLLDDTLSLQNLGFSDACVAALAPGDDMDHASITFEDPTSLISVSLDDYEILPKHMKSLSSWEDLVVAVEKMNACLRRKNTKPSVIQMDEVESLGLGPKARSYLLLLIKMNRLVVETARGSVSYRIL